MAQPQKERIEQSGLETEVGGLATAAWARNKAVTWRSVLLCLILLPINSYWVVQMEVVRYSAHPTTISLLFNTIFELLVLTVLNKGVQKIAPRWALQRGELLLIYTILCIGSCVSGHDMLQVFVPMLTWTFKHMNSSNGWEKLINPHLRPGLFISDEAIWKGYYQGNDSIWQWKYIRAWLPVTLIWTAFVSTLLFVMLSINALLRKQWTDNERLTYPIVQLPLQITSEQAFQPKGVFRNRLFWAGFIIAGLIDQINSLNYYYPSIPTVFTPGFGQSFLDLGQFFTSKPWYALGWTPLSFYPFMIGLGMLMPLDFLFSCVFFYWFWKFEKVASVALAFDQDPRFPYTENQAFGAYLSFCLFSIYVSRNYIVEMFRRAFGRRSTLDDTHEPMRYRTAMLSILVGVAALVAFGSYLGMPWWIGVAFFGIYFALALAITRMRAELGTPMHDLHFTGPETIMTRVFGVNNFDADNLTVFALFFWFNRAYRSHPMPHQLEGFKLAEQSRTEYRKWSMAMLILGSIAVFVAFWAILHLMYHYGAEAKSKLSFGAEPFNKLEGWLKTPQHGKFEEFLSICIGFGIAFLLQFLRMRFPWWPLHPLAFAVTSSWEINLVWGPLFLAWIFKSLILRYGGRGGFQKALPFFIGLMLGQFVVGSLWNIYGIWRDFPTYQFWQ
ncbi:MAG TPA: DUF6785 family protein [Chthonomonadaceae bacterium]|nr:DUF6785 family protein [Chthonomonadaceae bacterium]